MRIARRALPGATLAAAAADHQLYCLLVDRSCLEFGGIPYTPHKVILAEPMLLDDHLDEFLAGRAVQLLRCQLAILIGIGGIEALPGD